MATKWYCPPAVGNAESISANDAARHKLQIPAVTKPHITELGPPLGKASDNEALNAVHELRIAKASPNIDLSRVSFGLYCCALAQAAAFDLQTGEVALQLSLVACRRQLLIVVSIHGGVAVAGVEVTRRAECEGQLCLMDVEGCGYGL